MSEDLLVCPRRKARISDIWDHDWSTSDVLETSCGMCDGDLVLGRNVRVTYHLLGDEWACREESTEQASATVGKKGEV